MDVQVHDTLVTLTGTSFVAATGNALREPQMQWPRTCFRMGSRRISEEFHFVAEEIFEEPYSFIGQF